MFRRRLLKRTAVFLAGSLAFPYVSQFYPPLDLDLMLVFFGMLFFVGLTIAVVLDRRAQNRRELEALKRVYSGFIPLPWILAAMLLANGALDSKENVTYYTATVVNRYNMPGIVRGTRRLIVRSWRDGEKVERLAVNSDDFDRFHSGDAVSVGVKPGALAIPWYFGVYRR
jgi:hypothetical protein